jgi:outer membrane lipoprotein-sorting protein
MNRSLSLCCVTLAVATVCSAVVAGHAIPQQQKSKQTGKAKSAVQADNTFRNNLMLAKVLARYRGMKSLEQSVKGKVIINAEGIKINADFTSMVRLAQPNKFKIVSKINFFGEEKHGTVISDGTTVWDLDEDSKQYSERPVAEITKDEDKFTDWLMDRGGLDLTMIFFLEAASAKSLGLPKDLGNSIQVNSYPTKVVDGVPMYVIPVHIDKKKAKGSGGSVTLYVDTKDLLVRRLRYSVVTATTKEDPKSAQVEFVFFHDAIKPEAQIPDDGFSFTAPADATKVKEVKPVFDRAFDR